MTLPNIKQSWLLFTNTLMSVHWWYVLALFLIHGYNTLSNPSSPTCTTELRPRVLTALTISTLELLNSLTGITKSKPQQVFLFASARTGIELLLAPLLPCAAWQHLLTCGIWGLGDGVRFGCFALDAAFGLVSGGLESSPHWIKTVRYTVGPLLFPLGVGAEMTMVVKAAGDGRPGLYALMVLWAMGFFPLMKQLLRQRSKHMERNNVADDFGNDTDAIMSKVKLF